MSIGIMIEEDVYEHLVALKQDSRDSFSRVIRRHIPKRLDTAGELLDAYEHVPLPKLDWEVLDKVATGRGRRSGGRK
jgi:predicted CopG family antitoxin